MDKRTSYNSLFTNHKFKLLSTLYNIEKGDTLGGKIRNLRMSVGLTQKQFGQHLGKALNTIANYENGYRKPPQDILNLIIELYDLDKNYFNI
ncbi:helix-turn-helix transcriptional regulator [Clostridium sp.]|uniref:helix-turn-helix domain-containing protein n=1 Tax=Clostridium sp. TaxID=1506 RepID=UPI00283FDE06|nr:helix-turn-helix transcriptional regulator [Clostridium sp.]MDR3593578.1 helix-turn-helix transcriptional regulator [Clostridium sp.]